MHQAGLPHVNPRVFVPFFIGSLALTLTWGATLGMINLARLTAGWGLGTLPRPSVWAHGYVQVFGFMALFIMGVAYHVIPRFVGGVLQHARLVRWSFWLQLGGVVTIACGFFHDGILTRPLWIAGGALLLTASALFCTIMLRTMASGVPRDEPFRPWIQAGACWLPLTSALALTAAVANDTTWHRVLWTAALFGFIASWIFGVGRRILPIFLGCQPRFARIERPAFVAYQLGVAAWIFGAWPALESPVFDAARGAGALLLVGSVIAYTASLGLFGRIGPAFGCGIRNPLDGWQKFVFAAWSWLFVSLALGPAWTAGRLFTGAAEPQLIYDFGRHAMAFGFAAQMVIGVASRVVPNFTGKPLWSSHLRDASFYLLNASMATRALQVPIAMGFWTSAWNAIAWSGPSGVLALLLFAVNLTMTIRQQAPAVLQPPISSPVGRPVVRGQVAMRNNTM